MATTVMDMYYQMLNEDVLPNFELSTMPGSCESYKDAAVGDAETITRKGVQSGMSPVQASRAFSTPKCFC